MVVGSVMTVDRLSPEKKFLVFPGELVIDEGNVPTAVSPSLIHSAGGADICRKLPEAAYVT